MKCCIENGSTNEKDPFYLVIAKLRVETAKAAVKDAELDLEFTKKALATWEKVLKEYETQNPTTAWFLNAVTNGHFKPKF